MTPSQFVISSLGGVTKTAKLVGLHPSSVCRWNRLGRVPHRHHLKILQVAKRRRLDITERDLIRGR